MPAIQELLNQGRYRLGQPLGSAEESTVFNAYDTVSNVNVVVKEIPMKLKKVTTLSQQENIKLAFTNQAQVLKDIRHEHLLNVEDYFCDVGKQFLVLESVDGQTLDSLLSSGNLDASNVSSWADQILEALDFLAAQHKGMIHGRIDPRNIQISNDGRVKLLSVGVSDGQDVSIDTSLDQDANSSAYLCYSPLEQIWDSLDAASQKVILNSYDERSEAVLLQPADSRSDVYSVGAVLYHVITGRKPVDALERSIEILDGKSDPLVAPIKAEPEMAKEFSDFVMRALEIKRESRFDNVAVMRQALKTVSSLIAEREDEERREQEEAANDLKFAVTSRTGEVQKAIEAKKRELEEEQERQREILEAKLREAEEQRLEAERRAAEAERLLKEQEAAAAEAARLLKEKEQAAAEAEAERLLQEQEASNAAALEAKAANEDDLLGISTTDEPVSPKPVAVAKKKSASVHVSAPPAQVAEEIIPVTDITVEPDNADLELDAHTLENEDEDLPVVEASVVEPSATSYVDSPLSFETEPVRSGLPLPAIVGGVIALLAVVAGVWFFAIRGSEPPPAAAPTQAVAPVQQPVVTTETPAVEPIAVEPAATEPSQSESGSPDIKAASAAPTPVKAVKKPTPEKAKPEPAKKVTVDDLINDN